jgi:hypothetical protein
VIQEYRFFRDALIAAYGPAGAASRAYDRMIRQVSPALDSHQLTVGIDNESQERYPVPRPIPAKGNGDPRGKAGLVPCCGYCALWDLVQTEPPLPCNLNSFAAPRPTGAMDSHHCNGDAACGGGCGS